MLSMILPGMAVTYNGDEIGMVDKRDITWEATQDPQACSAGKEKYVSVSRDPERTPFQWDKTKNAGKGTNSFSHTACLVKTIYITIHFSKFCYLIIFRRGRFQHGVQDVASGE